MEKSARNLYSLNQLLPIAERGGFAIVDFSTLYTSD